MKFKCDENLPQEATELLRQAGYDAFSIHDQGMVGALDTTIAAVCQSENRNIIILDTLVSGKKWVKGRVYAGDERQRPWVNGQKPSSFFEVADQSRLSLEN